MKTMSFEITEEQERAIRTCPGMICNFMVNERTGQISLVWGCIAPAKFIPGAHDPDLKEHRLVATIK